MPYQCSYILTYGEDDSNISISALEAAFLELHPSEASSRGSPLI